MKGTVFCNTMVRVNCSELWNSSMCQEKSGERKEVVTKQPMYNLRQQWKRTSLGGCLGEGLEEEKVIQKWISNLPTLFFFALSPSCRFQFRNLWLYRARTFLLSLRTKEKVKWTWCRSKKMCPSLTPKNMWQVITGGWLDTTEFKTKQKMILFIYCVFILTYYFGVNLVILHQLIG